MSMDRGSLSLNSRINVHDPEPQARVSAFTNILCNVYMNQTIDSSRYQLAIDGQGDRAIFVFLEGEQEGDRGDRVSIQLLAPTHRFGGTGGVAMGRPILGRWPNGMNRFRQFQTVTEMEKAGWVPVKHYRFVDDWDDYYSPWTSAPAEDSAAVGSTDHLTVTEY